MEQKIQSEKSNHKPKTPPTKRKTRATKLSKEQILIALQKKKECNARAQQIVETFLDPVPPEKIDFFLSNLIHINQAHYDDIVEERSISMLCGYPMCDVTLTNIPKQQYIISSTQNKVYDITERKKFCSNKCYKSSIYIREQILITPLWVRKEDDVIPEFKLLSFDDDDDKCKKKSITDHKDDSKEKNNVEDMKDVKDVKSEEQNEIQNNLK